MNTNNMQLRQFFENIVTGVLLKIIRFGYKPICSSFATTYYVTTYKTIHMYYLKKSHDSLNRSCN